MRIFFAIIIILVLVYYYPDMRPIKKSDLSEENQIRVDKIEKEKIEKEKSDKLKVKKTAKSLSLVRSRIYSIETRYDVKTIVEFKLKNETKYPVAAVSMNLILMQAGRSIPLFEDDYSTKFSGGLEPGEEITFELTPDQFGNWRNTRQHYDERNILQSKEDRILSISNIVIFGANGKIISDYE